MTRLASSDSASTSTAIMHGSLGSPTGWDDVRFQRLWLATQKREWGSLAVLSASSSIATLHIAEMLAQLAWRYRGQPSSVFDLRDLSMRLVDYQVRELHAHVEGGTRVLIALRSIFENPTAIPIAQQADAVVLCIALGETDFKGAEQTIAEVGRDRVIGAIVMRPGERGSKKKNGAAGAPGSPER